MEEDTLNTISIHVRKHWNTTLKPSGMCLLVFLLSREINPEPPTYEINTVPLWAQRNAYIWFMLIKNFKIKNGKHRVLVLIACLLGVLTRPQENLKEGAFVFRLEFKGGLFIVVGKSCSGSLRQLVTSYSQLGSRGWWTLVPKELSPFYAVQNPSPGKGKIYG